MTNKKTIFISYSSNDSKLVNKIVKELDQNGISCWKAPEMIPAGSSYAKEIPKAIQSCCIFLLMLSPSSQDSIWVEKEIDSAICNRKRIIPFEISKLVLNDTFQFYLNNVQKISAVNRYENAFIELKKEIKKEIKNNDDVVVQKTDVVEVKSTYTKIEDVEEVDTEIRSDDDPRNRILSINPMMRDKKERKKIRNTNALRLNRIPLACQYCGCKELDNITIGTYRCTRCGKDNYDDFQTIRNYLEKAGEASALVIERETGVPRRIIEYFFKDEYLEIPSSSPVRIPCASCGAPIRTGVLCEQCKKKSISSEAVVKKGKWHLI